MELYTASKFREIVGISQDLLSQWLRGYVEPDERSDRSGVPHKYSASTICQIVFFKDLLNHGYRRERASAISFSKGVKKLFEEIIKSKTILNAMTLSGDYVGPLPVIQFAIIQYKNNEDDYELIADALDFKVLYNKATKADCINIYNITGIALKVLKGLISLNN